MGRTTPKGGNNRRRNHDEPVQTVSTRVKVVAIIAAMAMILPLIATVAAVTSDPGDGLRDQATRCRVTEAGVQTRAAGPVAVDQLPDGQVGETYTSTSGCVPGDTGI